MAMNIASATELFAPLLGSEIFHDDVSAASADSLTQTYAVLDFVEKLCKKRKEEIKPVISAVAQAVGKKTTSGSRVFETTGAKATLQTKVSKLPNDASLRELLLGKSIELEEAYDVIKSLVLNPSKLESLISLGRLSQHEVDALKSSSSALTVSLDKKAKDKLEEHTR